MDEGHSEKPDPHVLNFASERIWHRVVADGRAPAVSDDEALAGLRGDQAPRMAFGDLLAADGEAEATIRSELCLDTDTARPLRLFRRYHAITVESQCYLTSRKSTIPFAASVGTVTPLVSPPV